MLVDFDETLYDPVYAAFGVDAIITPTGTGAPTLSVIAIDKTKGAEVPAGHSGAGSGLVVGTIRPCADVRMAELLARLAEHSLTLDALNEATITLQPPVGSPSTWSIKSHYPKGGPFGEEAGERRLVLSA
jgi:hypothetical protein